MKYLITIIVAGALLYGASILIEEWPALNIFVQEAINYKDQFLTALEKL